MKKTYPLERVTYSAIDIPPYYISVVAQNLEQRKKTWVAERANGLPPREAREWSPPPPEDPSSSLIVRVENGRITHSTYCGFAHGTLPMGNRLLNAQHGEVVSFKRDLTDPQPFASLPMFNDLHTIRETPKGFLLVSSGTDAIFELSKDGKEILWSWFGGDHGFNTDSYGKKRELDKHADHRNLWYHVWLHTTHINSALPYDDESVLATFFHQGILGKIDRATGDVTTLFSGMKRPHATRWSEEMVTFCSTVEGIAYRGKITGDTLKLEHSVRIETNWLQDCQFVNGYWMLVDAEHARVHFVDHDNKLLAYDQFDSDWDFFEISLA